MSGATYQVGAATVDITPSLRQTVYLAGFATNRTATAVLHPLELSALAITDGAGETAIMVTADLIGLLNPIIERIRSRVAHIADPGQVLVCSTHTHSGPDTLGLWGPSVLGVPYRSGIDQDYLGTVVEAAGRAIEDALAARRPATLKATEFNAPPHWVRNDRKGGGAYRKTVVLAAHDAKGPYALLLNFAAHPEALWEDNRAISPDYPAPCRDHLRTLGWRFPLFFAGPIGAMLTPAVPENAELEDRVRYIGFFGKMLAELAHTQSEGAPTLDGPLKVARQSLPVTNANPRFDLARRLGFVDRPVQGTAFQTEIMALRIGHWRASTIPGEASPEVGKEAARALGGDSSMLLALGQDELGYIIPASAFKNREYRYEQTMSVGPHMAGLVVQTIARLAEQLNDE